MWWDRTGATPSHNEPRKLVRDQIGVVSVVHQLGFARHQWRPSQERDYQQLHGGPHDTHRYSVSSDLEPAEKHPQGEVFVFWRAGASDRHTDEPQGCLGGAGAGIMRCSGSRNDGSYPDCSCPAAPSHKASERRTLNETRCCCHGRKAGARRVIYRMPRSGFWCAVLCHDHCTRPTCLTESLNQSEQAV